jgi:hypothetical protein
MVVLLVLASTAQAQEGRTPAACEALAQVLAQARDSGALERVTTEYGFEVRQELPPGTDAEAPRPGLILLRCEPTEDGGLRFHVRIGQPLNDMLLDMQARYLLGRDGRLREFLLVAALRDAEGEVLETEGEVLEGRVVEGALRVTRTRHQRPPRTARHPWDDALVPQMLALFVLPRLYDQGLPERFTFRALDFERPALHTSTLRLDPEPAVEQGASCRVLRVQETGDKTEILEVYVADEGDAAGEVIAMRMIQLGEPAPDQAKRTIRPLAADDLAERRAALFGQGQ